MGVSGLPGFRCSQRTPESGTILQFRIIPTWTQWFSLFLTGQYPQIAYLSALSRCGEIFTCLFPLYYNELVILWDFISHYFSIFKSAANNSGQNIRSLRVYYNGLATLWDIFLENSPVLFPKWATCGRM